MKSFKQLRESELAKQVLASAKKVSPTANIDTRSPAERKADTDKMLAARAAAKPKVTNQPSKPSTPEQQMKNQNASMAASYAKHKPGQYVGDSVELEGDSINEDHYERAEDSKTLANTAKNEGDEIGFNSHMADHHDHLSQWHEEKGRASAAQSHADKSEMYASKMTQVAKGVAEAFANPGSGSTGTSRGAKRIANTVRKALAKNSETHDQIAARKDFEAQTDARMRQKKKEQGMAEGSLEEDKGMSGYNKFKKEWRAKHGDTKPVPGYDSKEYTQHIYQQNDKKKGVAEASSAGARMQKALQKAKEDRERSERNAERLLNPVKKPVQPEPVKEESKTQKWIVHHEGQRGEGGKMTISAKTFHDAWRKANEHDLDIIKIKPANKQDKKVAEEFTLDEGSFKYHMDKAIAAHEKGDDKKKAYHLENARTAKFAMKTADYAKNRELLDKHKQMSEEVVSEEKPGLYANIHAKRKRIAAGSGERMRKPGSKGAPTAKAFKQAQKTVKENIDDGVNEGIARLISKSIKNVTATKKTPQEKADIRLNNLNK